MARTVADAFNQYHQNYVKPQVESKLSTSAAAATYATQASLAVKADLDSPNFTGTPTAPTAGNDTDSTQIATTEFCQNLIRRLVGSAPETLNTLVELATAINNDPNFAETIVQALDGKLNKTDAANTYLAKTANAASASRDENGNVIHTTYATKSELGNVNVTPSKLVASDNSSISLELTGNPYGTNVGQLKWGTGNINFQTNAFAINYGTSDTDYGDVGSKGSSLVLGRSDAPSSGAVLASCDGTASIRIALNSYSAGAKTRITFTADEIYFNSTKIYG